MGTKDSSAYPDILTRHNWRQGLFLHQSTSFLHIPDIYLPDTIGAKDSFCTRAHLFCIFLIYTYPT